MFNNLMKPTNSGMKIRLTCPARNTVKPRLHETVVRIHAVHLYANKYRWINLDRFHPLEQTLRFLTESLSIIKAAASNNRRTPQTNRPGGKL